MTSTVHIRWDADQVHDNDHKDMTIYNESNTADEYDANETFTTAAFFGQIVE